MHSDLKLDLELTTDRTSRAPKAAKVHKYFHSLRAVGKSKHTTTHQALQGTSLQVHVEYEDPVLPLRHAVLTGLSRLYVVLDQDSYNVGRYRL